MLKNNNMQEILNYMMLGDDNITGLPLKLASVLYHAFEPLLPIFLVTIFLMLTWNKFNGEQWEKILVSGIASLIGIFGSFYITSDEKFKFGNEEFNVPILISAESQLIRLGNELATETALQVLLGPKKDSANNGLFIKSFQESVFVDEQNKLRFTFTEEGVDNLENLKNLIISGLETTQLNNVLEFWKFKNQRLMMKVLNNDSSIADAFEDGGYLQKLIEQNIYELSYEKDGTKVYTPKFIKAPLGLLDMNVAAYYYSYLYTLKADKFIKTNNLVKTPSMIKREEFFNKMNRIQHEMAVAFLFVGAQVYNNKEETIAFPYSAAESSSNTLMNGFSYQQDFTRKSKEKLRSVYDSIEELFKDDPIIYNAKMKELHELITILTKYQQQVKDVYSICSLKEATYDLNGRTMYKVSKEPEEVCVNKYTDLLSETTKMANKYLQNKYSEKDSSYIKKMLAESPFIRYTYGLNKIVTDSELEAIKDKVLNLTIDVAKNVSNLANGTEQINSAYVHQNLDLNEENLMNQKNLKFAMENLKLYNNTVEKVTGRIKELQENNKFLFTEFAYIMQDEKDERNKVYQDLFGSMNSNQTVQNIEKMVKMKDGKMISWVELGINMAFLKDEFDSYIQYQMLTVDKEQTTKEKLEETLKIHETYSNEKIIDNVQNAATMYVSLKAVSNTINSLISVDSFTDLIKTPFKAITTIFKVGEELIKGASYLALVNIVIIGIIYVIPAVIWMISVFVWYFKTSIILAVLPLSIVMLSFINFNQVRTATLKLISLMLTPVVMVVMFFVIIQMSSMIPIFIDKMLPFLNTQFLMGALAPDTMNAKVTNTVLSSMDSALNLFELIKSLISMVLTLLLYTFFLKTSEYIDMIIGASVSTGEGERLTNKVMNTFKMDV